MSVKTILIFVMVSVGLLVGMTALLSIGSRPGEATESSPKAIVEKTMVDVGTIKVADDKRVDFTVKNEGKEPLKIANMNSSCGCTVGQFVYKEQVSKEYGMHAQSGYLGTIPPGEWGVIRVTYRPSQMPVYGEVERQVSVETNDPVYPKLTFTVKARVE